MRLRLFPQRINSLQSCETHVAGKRPGALPANPNAAVFVLLFSPSFPLQPCFLFFPLLYPLYVLFYLPSLSLFLPSPMPFFLPLKKIIFLLLLQSFPLSVPPNVSFPSSFFFKLFLALSSSSYSFSSFTSPNLLPLIFLSSSLFSFLFLFPIYSLPSLPLPLSLSWWLSSIISAGTLHEPRLALDQH